MLEPISILEAVTATVGLVILVEGSLIALGIVIVKIQRNK